MKLIKLFIGFFLVFNAVSASSISGNIYYKNQPLFGVNIMIKNSPVGVVSNEDGYYIITNLNSGKYTMIFDIIGYDTKEETVTLGKNESKILNVNLESKTIEFSPISIYGNKYYADIKEREISTTFISEKSINKMPNIAGPDIFKTIQTLPSVNSLNEFSSQLYVRGGTPDQNLVMINGAPIYQPYHMFGMATAMNLDAIENVVFSAGGFSAEYGDRVSSVLDITTKSGSEDFEAGISITPIISKITMATSASDKLRYRLSFRRSNVDLLANAIGTDFPYYFTDFQGKVSWLLNNKNLLIFNLFGSLDYFTDMEKKSMYYTIKSDTTKYYLKDEKNLNWQNLLYSIQYFSKLTENQSLQMTLYSSNLFQQFYFDNKYVASKNTTNATKNYVIGENEILEKYMDLNYSDTKNNLQDIGFKFLYNFDINKKMNLKTGVDFTKIVIDYQWNITNFENIYEDVTFFMDFAPDSFDYNKNYINISGFTSFNVQPLDKLNLLFSGRCSKNSMYKSIYFEPRFSSNYSLTDRLNMKMSFGKYLQNFSTSTEYGFYNLAEIYLVNDDRPLKSIHKVLELAYKISPITNLTLSLFEKETKNIVQNLPDNEGLYKNSKLQTKGIEVILNNFRLRNFYFNINYGYNDTKKSDNIETYIPNYNQKHKVTFYAGRQLGQKYRLDLVWSYATGRYANFHKIPVYTTYYSNQYTEHAEPDKFEMIMPKNLFQYPDFHRLDIKISRKIKIWKANGEFTFNIINLYNRNNVLYFKGVKIITDEEEIVDANGNQQFIYHNKYKLKKEKGFPILPMIGLNLNI